MSRIERFEDIESWKKARALTKEIYRLTTDGALAKDYGLRDQMRRAAVSILSNIAEGFERNGNKEFVQFLYIAKGSCGELRAQLYVALDQQHLSEPQFKTLHDETCYINQMLSGFIKYLQQSDLRGDKYKQ